MSRVNEWLRERGMGVALWFMNVGDKLWALSYEGSEAEIQSVYDGEIPPYAMSARQRAALLSGHPAYCVNCMWDGILEEAVNDNCPNCANPVHLHSVQAPASLQHLRDDLEMEIVLPSRAQRSKAWLEGFFNRMHRRPAR